MTAMRGKGGSNPVLDCFLYVLMWAWNHPRMKSVRKFLYNFKLTVICGVITLLVFRGTMGAGKFGTVSQDIQLVNFELKSFQEDRLLQSAASQQLLWEESVESSKPYRIGPPVTDWDEQRGKILAMDPGCNVTSKGAPLTMIVSGSQPTPCEHNVGDHLLTKFLKTKMDYARAKSMRVYYHMTRLDKEMTGLWAKLPLLRRLMVANPGVEWFWWMDADAAITDMKFDIPWKRYEGVNMVVPGWDELVYDEKDWVGLSTGSFLLRNCQWSLDLLEAWSKMGVRGKARNDAGKQLTASLKGRPDIPADDQSALVYLMVQDRPKWGSKVHLEHKYYLHGYWVNLVDKFEKMMETSKPGTGDDRWPFVVHFIGCQLCGSNGEYDANKCITQMVRAFNFADNQVVKPFGYKHLRLNSSILLPTNESTRINIVETHYLRKKQQKARKEKVGEGLSLSSLALRNSAIAADAKDSAMAVAADKSLVDELLSEGVLALAPGSSPSTDLASLHVVSRSEKRAAAAAAEAAGVGQKAGGIAGQSVAFGAGGGQSVPDWRDSVEGITEEELQEKKLEEAESQQLLQLEGGALEAAKLKERAQNGGSAEESEDANQAGEGGSIVDRLSAGLRKSQGEGEGEDAEAESAGEGAEEGEGAAEGAQKGSAEGAVGQGKSTEEDAELASEAAKGETQRLESRTTLNSDSLSPLTEALPDTTETTSGATADASADTETEGEEAEATGEREGVSSAGEAQEGAVEGRATVENIGSKDEGEEEGEPSTAATATGTNGLSGTVKASAEGAEEGEESEADSSATTTTAGAARLRTVAGAGKASKGEEGSDGEGSASEGTSEGEGEGEGGMEASTRTGPVARSLVKPGVAGTTAGLGMGKLEPESEGDSASESDGETVATASASAGASDGASGLSAGTRAGATSADETAEEASADEAAADDDLKVEGVESQTAARRPVTTPGATSDEEAQAEDQLPAASAEGAEGEAEGEQTEGSEGSMMQ